MFHSGGYFRSANCPFFVHGLCHRPYCHFRHAKPEYKPTSISTSSVANEPTRSRKSENSKSAKAECPKKDKIWTEDRKIKVKADDDVKHELHDKPESVPPPTNPLFKRTALEEKLIAISANMEETFSESDSDCSETSHNNEQNNSQKSDDKVVNESVKNDFPNKTYAGKVSSVTEEVRSVGEDVKPVAEEVKPVAEEVKPVAEDVKPVAEDVKPVAEDVKPVAEAIKPVSEGVMPVAECVMPVAECVMPVGEEEATPVAQEVRSVAESIRDTTADDSDSKTKSNDDKVKTKKAVVEYLPDVNVTGLVSDSLEIENKDEVENSAKSKKIAGNEESLDVLIGDLQKYGKGVQNIERKKVEIKDETNCVKETCGPETPQLTDVNFFSSIVVKRSSSKKKKTLSKAAGSSSGRKRVVKDTEVDDKETAGSSSGRKRVAKDTEVDDKEVAGSSSGRKRVAKADTAVDDKGKISTEKKVKKKKKTKKTKKSSEAKTSSTKEKSKIQRYKELKKMVKDSGESLVSVAASSKKDCDKREKTKNVQTIFIDSDSDRKRGDMEEDSEENELLKIFNDYEPSEEPDSVNVTENCVVEYNQNNGQSSSAQLVGTKRPSTEKVAVMFKKQRVAHQPNLTQRPAAPSRNSSSTFRRLPRPLVGTLTPLSQVTKRQAQPQGDKDLVTTTHVKQRVTHYAKSAGTTYIRPRVRLEYGAKVPQNVRQKYLDKLVDEYLCLYEDQQEAFDKAEKEERAVYIKSPRRQVYINVCVNLIKRLRDGDEQPKESDESKVEKRNPLAAKSSLPSPQKRLSIDTSLTSLPEYIQPQVTIANVVKKTGNVNDEMTEEVFYTRLKKYLLSEDELVANGFPRATNIPGRAEITDCYGKLKRKFTDPTRYTCCRCAKPFVILESGEYQNNEECVHHHGRLFRRKTGGDISTSYTCCQGESGCLGCSVAKAHVKEIDWSEEGGFMKTIPCPFSSSEKIYALDCEMCYTTKGLELTRVTVVDYKRQQVYDTLVKPDNVILDYNTRFSGITEECMMGIKTTLPEVQAVLLSMIHEDTILLGHSLESDLKSLKLIHSTVVDTSVVFPHRLGPPYKRALRTLMGEFARKIIQDSEEGHDSLEDAVSCVELMLWKIKEDMKVKEKTKKQ